MPMRAVVFLALFSLPLFALELDCAQRLEALGSHYDATREKLRFQLFSEHAEKIQLVLFAEPHGPAIGNYFLKGNSHGLWSIELGKAQLAKLRIRGKTPTLYYGYRLWGPNWEYREEWKPGTEIGFIADVDAEGNRFNPNKLVSDPYSRELSHDPLTTRFPDKRIYESGEKTRRIDTSRAAPKSVLLPSAAAATFSPLRRPLKDEVIYEAHLRGLTMLDATIPIAERGTYRGAGRKAKYLSELGVTAIEFLPIHESQNETNSEKTTEGNNYWGYMTLNFFSPDRRYATEKSRSTPGGVTEEFREMIQAFHREGIKVYLDVVYNHTAEAGVDRETGNIGSMFSFRGIDNSVYYQTIEGRWYQDNTGCGANFNCAHSRVRDLILDSLYYYRTLGVDGFRFDLASVLGNTQTSGPSFSYDKMPGANALNRMIRELPARPAEGGEGVDLIAEPWALGWETFQLGNFPYHSDRRAGFAEWNGRFRDTLRRSMNRVGYDTPTPGELAARLSGSPDLFAEDGRKPWHSINFVTAHDGFTLNDLVSFNTKQNNQSAPYGPSDGGDDHNHSWDQVLPGDTEEVVLARRRQIARNAIALTLLSPGVPMLVAGDEFLRTQRGNNNMWNVDSRGSWIDWKEKNRHARFFEFTQNLLALRKAHPGLRPAEFVRGTDPDADGVRSLSWYQANGSSAEDRDLPKGTPSYMSSTQMFLGMRIDTSISPSAPTSVYIAYNQGWPDQTIKLPTLRKGNSWHWFADTHAGFEKTGNSVVPGTEVRLTEDYLLRGRSVAVFIERRTGS